MSVAPLPDRSNTAIGCIGCHVTWPYDEDPCQAMNVHLHLDRPDRCSIQWRQRGLGVWQPVKANRIVPVPLTSRWVHWFRCSGLEPDTAYEFRLEESNVLGWFRTMPHNLTRPIRIALTSDIFHTPETMDAHARLGGMSCYDPDVMIMAGDFAHDDGFRVERVEHFWRAWFTWCAGAGGRLIPLVSQIGNHDGGVDEDNRFMWLKPFDWIHYTYCFFPQPPGASDRTFGVIDVGSYLSVISLDTGHVHPVDHQTDWLADTLGQRCDGRLLLPSFHVSPYPGSYDYDDQGADRIRDEWGPLFFRAPGVRLAHSGHNHVYAWSPRIKVNRSHPEGVLYLGQGCGFGTRPRDLIHSPESCWWVADGAGANRDESIVRGFFGLILTPEGHQVGRYTSDGVLIRRERLG